MRGPKLKQATVIEAGLIVRWYDIEAFCGCRLKGPNLRCFQEYQEKAIRKEPDCRFDGAVLKPHVLVRWEEWYG